MRSVQVYIRRMEGKVTNRIQYIVSTRKLRAGGVSKRGGNVYATEGIPAGDPSPSA